MFFDQVILTHSTEFTVDKSVDPSSSSVDPSSSSAGGNTTGNESSVAPSTSSDGSLMKNTVDYVKLAEDRAATIAALERRLGDLEAALGSGGAVPGIRDELYKNRSSRKTDSQQEKRSSGSHILLKIVSEN